MKTIQGVLTACVVSVLLAAGPAGTLQADEAAEPAPVETAAQAPAVTVTREGDLYDVQAQDAVLGDVLAHLATASEVDLQVDPALMGKRVTLNLSGVSYEKVVEALAGSHALIYERTAEGGYRLTSARLTGHQDFVAPPLGDLSRRERRTVRALTEQARKLLDQHHQIIQDAGELDYDQAKALVAERHAQSKALVEQLAALGPGGARAMLEASQGDTGTREKLALIEALALIEDAEASVALAKMYAEEDQYSLQRQIVGSLGHRKDAETEKTLTDMLASTADKRLRAGVVQALSGRPGAIDDLGKVAESADEDGDVRAEAIHSLGLTGGAEAQALLVRMAGDESYDLLLRKSAILELERAYGAAAVPSLETLLDNSDEGIRQSAVRALSRVDSAEATSLLQVTATSDVSAVIRAQAEAALARRAAPAPASAN